MLFTHASVKDKTHIQMRESNLTQSYFSTNNKEQKYITRQRNTQYKSVKKWDAGTSDTTHAQYHVWLRLKHITTLLHL